MPIYRDAVTSVTKSDWAHTLTRSRSQKEVGKQQLTRARNNKMARCAGSAIVASPSSSRPATADESAKAQLLAGNGSPHGNANLTGFWSRSSTVIGSGGIASYGQTEPRRNFLGTGGGADNDLRPGSWVPPYSPVKSYVEICGTQKSVVKEIVFGTTEH